MSHAGSAHRAEKFRRSERDLSRPVGGVFAGFRPIQGRPVIDFAVVTMETNKEGSKNIMPIPLDAPEVLNREFPEFRARLLQLAAALDRMDRAEGSQEGDSRRQKIRDALAILLDDSTPNRAERLQLLFSLPYDESWKKDFELGREG
jgi:hypothetical protein